MEVGTDDGVSIGIAIFVPTTSVFASDIAVSITLVELISADELKLLQDINNMHAIYNKIIALLTVLIIPLLILFIE